MTVTLGSITSAYSTSSSNAPSTTVPAGAVSGDKFIWLVMKANGDTITPPTGFTAIDSAGEASIGSGLFTFGKDATGTESGSFTGTASTYSKWMAICAVVKGASSTIEAHNMVVSYLGYVSSVPVSTGSVTSASSSFILGFFCATDVGSTNSFTFSPPASFTQDTLVEDGASRAVQLAYKTSTGETASYTGTLTPGTGPTTFSALGTAIVFTPTGGGGGTTLGTASEVDSAGALSTSYSFTLGSAAESDAPGALGAQYQFVLGSSVETDTASALSSQYTSTLTPAFESDVAGTPNFQYAFTLGFALEADTANPSSSQYSYTLQAALEVDTANALVAPGYLLATAYETDSAQALSAQYAFTLGSSLETDTANPITAGNVYILGTAVETDSANPVAASYLKTLASALETDAANGIVVPFVLGSASEADTANPAIAAYLSRLATAVESDSANALKGGYQSVLGTAHETDFAAPFLQIITDYLTGTVSLRPSLSGSLSLIAALTGTVSLKPN